MKSLGRRQANTDIIQSYQKKKIKKRREGPSQDQLLVIFICKFNPRTVTLLYICYLVIDKKNIFHLL